MYYWSWWQRILWKGFAVARLLGLWVRIPPGHICLSLVSVVCCQVEVSAAGRSLFQRSPTSMVCLSVISKPRQWEGFGPLGLSSHKNELFTLSFFVLSLYPIRKHLEYYRLNFINNCYIQTFWTHHNPSISTGFIYKLTIIFSKDEGRICNNCNYCAWNIEWNKFIIFCQKCVFTCWQ